MSLLGLGFGDCGKGLFTDFLSRHWQAHTVVRFNGGAQAGHNVVLPDGRHHTFSQFGAATFQPGVFTVLAAPVVVHPTALLIEHQALQRAGTGDSMARLLVDARCRVTTPFHQAAGRLRERLLGHGSCGVGVGETVRQSLEAPALTLRYGDLIDGRGTLDRLEALRRHLHGTFAAAARPDAQAAEDHALLADAGVAQRWLAVAQTAVRQSPPASPDAIAARLARVGTVLFEGAQGVLLDEWRGFHPHTTWSSISTHAVEAVLTDLGLAGPVRHLGVLRSHLTRHGTGPLPTADAALDILHEPHNADDGWQGAFRRGHPDAVLLRYALDVVGPLDGLLASHLDVFARLDGLRWCTGYRLASGALAKALPRSAVPDLAHQATLTQRLREALPVYDADALTTPQAWIERVEALAGVPVRWGSFAPTHEAVVGLAPL